jgi:hypothetical protein
MSGLVFDTLAYARRLEVAGFSRQQAETLAEEQAKLLDERLATKSDLAVTSADLRADIAATKTELKADIEALRLATNASIREAELRLEGQVEAVKADILKWMVGTIGIQTVVIVGAVTALVRLFIR